MPCLVAFCTNEIERFNDGYKPVTGASDGEVCVEQIRSYVRCPQAVLWDLGAHGQPRYDHRHRLSVGGKACAERGELIVLLEVHRDHDPTRRHRREEQTPRRHRRRGPERDDEAEVQWVANHPVETASYGTLSR